MVCTLQRKHDERYENKRKEALARINSLVQTPAGFAKHFTEEWRAKASLTVIGSELRVNYIIEKKRMVRYEWVRGPLTVLECIMMAVECIVMMVDPQAMKDANNLDFLQLTKESKATTKMWELGEDPDSDDD